MTFGALESGTSNNVRIPSIVILGADALLGALPATPIQLAHACMLAGYQTVVPASWGDELIAVASLRALRQHDRLPAIQCSCPHVAHRLLAVGADLRPFLVSLVAPPVALARYLRTMHAPRKLRITYVGRCPAAADEVIDARLTPEELLAIFADHQIAVEQQPDVFDSVIPPDRRRYRSQPGGLPTAEMLWSGDSNGTVGARSLVELFGDDLPVELAQHLLSGKPTLIDVAPKLGCVCSGAATAVDPMHARVRVAEIEPPRAAHAIVDESLVTETSLSLPVSPRSAIDLVSTSASIATTPTIDLVAPNDPSLVDESPLPSRTPRQEGESAQPTHASPGTRRYSPARGVARLTGAGLPTARDSDGRQLPRTYVARRRAPTRLGRAPTAELETPIASSTEASSNTRASAGSDEPQQSSPQSTAAVDTDIGTGGQTLAPVAGTPLEVLPRTVVAIGAEVVEVIAPRRAPAPAVDEGQDTSSRFAERAVALPVTRLSDARPREETPPHQAGERPVMQLLTRGLLISMIVLVSVAVGVLVGRWMTQR